MGKPQVPLSPRERAGVRGSSARDSVSGGDTVLMQKERNEARLLHHVREALARTPEVGAFDLNIEVIGTLVILSGAVDTLDQKLAAGRAVAAAPGVGQVENRLTVTTQGDIPETEIRRHLDQAAADAGGLPGMSWRLEEGVVDLGGRADSIADADQAQSRLAAVPGVKEVQRELGVNPEGLPMDDASLRDRVELALHDDAGTTWLPVDVRVERGVVTLSGLLRDLGERRRVEQVVRAVPGVGHLVSDLATQSGETGGPARLEAQVMAALTRAEGVDERRITVNLVGDVIHLDGDQRSLESKLKAGEVAAAVPGVRQVQNDLQVVSEF